MNTSCHRLLLLSLVLVLTACAHYPINQKKTETAPSTETAREKFSQANRSDETFMVLAFSGGGTRAAALSYGILEALADVALPHPAALNSMSRGDRPHRLLDEVDVITSVSGGSFTAAYYGLHGDGIFEDFEERFLTRNVERDLFLKVLAPHNWLSTLSATYGRSDLAAEYYDSILFDGKTLGDMWVREGPSVQIQATDIVNGYNFGFTPYLFGFICSDFDRFPVARAVAASAAFPGPFTPIVLKNYAGTCGLAPKAWIDRILANKDITSRSYGVAQKLNSYVADPEEKPYIHLMDGGIADNLGVRSALDLIQARGTASFQDIGLGNTRQAVFVVVNAASQTTHEWSPVGKIPGIGGIIGATSSVMVNTVVYDSIYLLNSYVEKWKDDYGRMFPSRPPLKTYIVLIEFGDLEDREERSYFQNIPTSLSLPKKSVDDLRGVARRLLYKSKPFQKLVQDLGGKIEGPFN